MKAALISFLPNQWGLFIREKRSIIAYLIVGFLSAIIYFSTFALLWQLIGLNYKASISITYFTSVLFHFSLNRRFTFKAHGKNIFQHLTKYALMIMVNYFITFSIMYLTVQIAHFNPYSGIVFSILVNISTNFLMSRYWVFHQHPIKQLA